jgi:PAS domain S-box-containing protein
MRDVLPSLPQSAGRARSLVRSALHDAGCREDLVDDAQLATSELVTNAVVHAGTSIGVLVSVGPRSLRVEVRDGSPNLPRARDYASTAGTGRGLHLVERLVTRWGVTSHPEAARGGKTVWFELALVPTGAAATGALPALEDDDPDAGVRASRGPGTSTYVDLVDLPVVLYQAWRQHADALLREHLLVTMSHGVATDAVRVHAEASDALALFDAAVPHRPRATSAAEALAAAEVTAAAPNTRTTVTIPGTSTSHFETLDAALEEAGRIGRKQRFLTPPVQPELRELRRWLCAEVSAQTTGAPPRPWRPSDEALALRDHDVSLAWDRRTVTTSPEALLAVDDTGRICAASRDAVRLLGYPRREDLLGLRLVVLVPQRFREAHLAGFTLHLLTGGGALLDTPVVVPVLGYDGGEILIRMTVREDSTGDARSVFVAELEPSGDAAPVS